jgi:hypothetical protein
LTAKILISVHVYYLSGFAPLSSQPNPSDKHMIAARQNRRRKCFEFVPCGGSGGRGF